ncbi:MAG: hypothetical protein CMH56_11590 [Myxococcales bacterium]|nr:hypothetical protein [Myxococcales bacterium]
MRTVQQTRLEVTRPSTFYLTAKRRQCLHRWIQNKVRMRTHPEKRSLAVVNKILEQQNANCCPLCGNGFDVDAYQETQTTYWACVKIRCDSCRHEWILQESHVV